jgi:hypothetical protein
MKNLETEMINKAFFKPPLVGEVWWGLHFNHPSFGGQGGGSYV